MNQSTNYSTQFLQVPQIPPLHFSHSRHGSLEINTQRPDCSFLTSLKSSKLGSSIDFQSLRQKQNIDASYLNHISHSINSKQQRNRAREKRLKNMRRYHSEKLLRQFTKQLESVTANDYEEQDFDQRIQKLQGAVKMLGFVKQMLENPQHNKQKERQKISFDQMQFGIGTIVDTYEFKLSKKEEEIRELKRKIQKLEMNRSTNKYQKSNQKNNQQYECHQQLGQFNSTLRSNIRGYLEESFGSLSQKKSLDNSLINSRQSLRCIDIMPVMSHRYIPPISLRSMRQSIRSSVDESIHIEDHYIVENENMEEDEVVNQDQDDYIEERQLVVEELEQIEEEVHSKGYQTGRFAQNFSPIKVNSSNQFTNKLNKISNRLSFFTAQNITVKGQQTKKATIAINICQTHPKSSQNKSIQTLNQSRMNRFRTDSEHTGKLTKASTTSIPISQQSSFQINKQLQLNSTTLSLSIQPLKIPKKPFSKVSVFEASLNSQYLGSRFKTHKSMVKMVVGLLSHIWRMTYKILRVYQTVEQEAMLNQVKSKLSKFTDQFNQMYVTSKSGNKPEDLYKKNIQQLKSIQELLVQLVNHKV